MKSTATKPRRATWSPKATAKKLSSAPRSKSATKPKKLKSSKSSKSCPPGDVPTPPAPPLFPPGTVTAESPLSPAEQEFVTQYLIHFRAGRAYRDTHPNVTRASAGVLGCLLLKKVNVRAEIEAELRDRRRAMRLDVKTLLTELIRVGFADLADCYDLDGRPRSIRDIPTDTRRALQSHTHRHTHTETDDGEKSYIRNEVEHTFRLADKGRALAKLYKYLGLERDETPLEVILGCLPVPIANQLRLAIATTTRATPVDVTASSSDNGKSSNGDQASHPKPDCVPDTVELSDAERSCLDTGAGI